MKCQTKKVFELSQNKIIPRDASFKDKQQKSSEKIAKSGKTLKKEFFVAFWKLSFKWIIISLKCHSIYNWILGLNQ